MKRLVGLGLVAGALLLGAAPSSASTDAFTGAWTATDSDDGSALVATIGAAGTDDLRHVTLVDELASACDAPATASGWGVTSGSSLSATLDVRCGGAPYADDVPYTFQAQGATLIGGGLVFRRVGR